MMLNCCFFESLLFQDNNNNNNNNGTNFLKLAPFGCVTKTELSSNTFIDDLVRLSQTKSELQSLF